MNRIHNVPENDDLESGITDIKILRIIFKRKKILLSFKF